MIVALGALPVAAQPDGDPASVQGQVLNAVTGEVLRKAQVILMRIGGGGRGGEGNRAPLSALTDAGGNFEITDVPPGHYRLSVQRQGFARQEYGQRSSNRSGTTLLIGPGQHLRDITVKLLPSAVITGRVINEDGEPASNVRVSALRSTYSQGRRELAPAAFAMSNDLGDYRIFGLAPGRYYIQINPGPVIGGGFFGGRMAAAVDEGYAALFYPNTADPEQAAPVELTPGQEMRGIDFSLSPVRTARVRGRLTGLPEGRRNASIFLMPRHRRIGGFAIPRSPNSVAPDGSFDLRGVIPGSYFLIATVQVNRDVHRARVPIEVGPDGLNDLEVPLVPGMELQGAVRVEGGGNLDAGRLLLLLIPQEPEVVGAGGQNAAVNPDLSFAVRNVAPNAYFINLMGLPKDYYVKSARFGTEEALVGGLDLTGGFAAARLEILVGPGGQITGGVMQEGRPTPGATVVLVPETNRRGNPTLFKAVTANEEGGYMIQGIPPGEYKLFAWEDVEPGAYFDPDFLRRYENSGQSVTVRERGQEMITLTAISGAAAGY